MLRFHRPSGLRRFLILVTLFGLLFPLLPVLPAVPATYAQDQSAPELGEPPATDGLSLANEPAGSNDITSSIPVTVDLSTRASAQAFFAAHFQQSFPATGWNGNVATCDPGTLSTEYKQAFLNQIAWYRVMAGVPGLLALSEEYSAKAQQAALMMYAKWELSHSPEPNWPCYTADGAEGAGSSNLALASSDFVSGYIQDSGSDNSGVGHRRWLLYPQTRVFGVGTVGSANATWVFDPYMWDPRPATRDGFIAWPPPGYVPYQVVYPRWSFSYAGADFTSASVIVKKNGSTVASPIEHRGAAGSSENLIVFGVGGASWIAPSTDLRYEITINNVQIDGVIHSFTYEVVIFDPDKSGNASMPGVSLESTTGGAGETLDYTLSGFPANSPVTITWNRSTTTSIDLGTIQTNSAGASAGSLTVPSIPGGVNTIVFSSGAISKLVLFEVIPRLEVLTPWVAAGGEVSIRVSGLRSNEWFDIDLYSPELDTSYWIESGNIQANANGEQTVDFTIPGGISPGAYEIHLFDSSWRRYVANGPVLLTDPPHAETEGSLDLQTDSLLTAVTLDASGSTGADGVAITSFDWSTDGTTIASGQAATVELPVGSHDLLLTITDAYGLTAIAPLSVTISVAPETAIANAGPDQYVATVGGATDVTLDGSGSLLAPGTTITAWSWTIAGQPTPIATISNPVVLLPDGTHEITLTVTSNFGISTSDVVQVVIGPPVVANAGPDQDLDTYGATAQVTLDGRGSTPPAGGAITEYRWSGLPGGDLTGATPTVILWAGEHTATLTVTASNGMIATDTITIKVTSIGLPELSITPTRAAPAANVTYTATNFLRGSEVEITWISNQGVITSLGSVVVPESGVITGQVAVEAGPGGFGNFLRFSLGNVSASAEVDVAPRISPSVTTAAPGQEITLNLRGFARNDNVVIRWRVGNAWIDLGTARTTNTGSLTRFPITIPANAEGGLSTIRVQGTISQNTSTVTIVAPAVSITPERTTVNNKITYAISDFPANSVVSITWVRLTGSTIDLGTVQTDSSGSADGQITVPATPGGPGQQIRFSADGITRTVLFEVAPRIKVTPAPAGRGGTLDISLRGFARQEPVRIRWRASSSEPWIEIATGQTSNTGSANIYFEVPNNWSDDVYSMRAETASFNQQTNVVEIEGGAEFQVAEETIAPPTPEVTETPATIDRTALPLDVPLEIVAASDEAGTPGIERWLTDGDLATGWSGAPDPVRNDARLTLDLGSEHAVRGVAWVTESGGCGVLTGLQVSLDGETWTAVDPYLEPGVIGDGMVWRYQPTSLDGRFIRFTFAPEIDMLTLVGCIAEVAVWGTPVMPEAQIPEEPSTSDTTVEEPPVEPEPDEASTPEAVEEPPIDPTESPDTESENGQ